METVKAVVLVLDLTLVVYFTIKMMILWRNEEYPAATFYLLVLFVHIQWFSELLGK